MLIQFTNIPEKLKYPPTVKGILSSYHSSIVLYTARNFKSTKKFRRQVINTMNTITYHVINQNELPDGWTENNPILAEDLLVDEYTCRDELGALFIDESDIEWDVDEIVSTDEVTPSKPAEPSVRPAAVSAGVVVRRNTAPKESAKTNIEDLSIQPPNCPQVDFSKPWFSRSEQGITYAIYPTLPAIPTTQREVSITTDVNMIPDHALLALYPNTIMQTRGSALHEKVEKCEWSDELGVIFKIDKFNKRQIIDNIVKYPHLYNVKRYVDGQLVPFHKYIEIDGVLQVTGEVWDTLPDTKNLPKTTPFVKEYVIRRYLLERDVAGIDHTSKIFGDLSPFLTLFMPQDSYAKFGYTDAVDIAKKCVNSRVAYKQTRNPVLRRFLDE